MKSAVTVSLVPEAKGGPFCYWGDLAKAFEDAGALGFDGIEIFPISAEQIDVRQLRLSSERHGIKVAAIGSGAGWVRQKLSLTDSASEIRRRAYEFIRNIIDVAGEIGAPVILGSMQGNWGGSVSRESAVGFLGEALESLGNHAEKFGVSFLYEPLNRYESNLFNRISAAAEFLQGLKTQNVKLLCDLFHMNIEESDIADALLAAGPKIGHVHFVDSNRRAVGLGHTPMKPIMDALMRVGYTGYLSAEVLPLPDSHTAAKQTIESIQKLTNQH